MRDRRNEIFDEEVRYFKPLGSYKSINFLKKQQKWKTIDDWKENWSKNEDKKDLDFGSSDDSDDKVSKEDINNDTIKE